MSTDAASFASRITDTSYTAASPAATESQLPASVYFSIELIDDSVSLNPFEEAFGDGSGKPTTLKPDRTYELRVAASHQGTTEGCWEVPATSDLRLMLDCPDKRDSLEFDRREWSVPQAQIPSFSQPADLKVKADCAAGQVTFMLIYSVGQRWQRAAVLSLHLDGALKELKETLKVDLSTPVADEVAMLHVEAPEAGKLKLTGYHKREKQVVIGPLSAPDVSLAKLWDKTKTPQQIRDDMRSFSRRAPRELNGWLKRLLREYPQKLCLVVVDYSVSEIPWEMVEVEDGQYLGAESIMARWIPVTHYGDERLLQLEAAADAAGGMLSFVDKEETDVPPAHEKFLEDLNPSSCQDTDELKQRLKTELEGVSFVYVYCHGRFVYNEKHETAIGSLYNPKQALVTVQLEQVPRYQGERPLVFINACHSGRLMDDANGLYGLAEVLLARVAKAYVGTMGLVLADEAATVAERMFQVARDDEEGVQPAELLRRLRARAAKSAEEKDSEEAWDVFLNTFLYVYYGNPQARFCLRSGEFDEPGGAE